MGTKIPKIGKRLQSTAHLEAETLDMESTLSLLERARLGDHDAVEILMARFLPRVRRWASGRLPQWARSGLDTQDLVQDVLLRTFLRLQEFEDRGDGAFQAYLRQAVLNAVRDELRRAARNPPPATLDADVSTLAPSPLEELIGRDALANYERGLSLLKPSDREAVIARIEMGCSFQEVADALNKPSANAARMMVERALIRLAVLMGPQ